MFSIVYGTHLSKHDICTYVHVCVWAHAYICVCIHVCVWMLSVCVHTWVHTVYTYVCVLSINSLYENAECVYCPSYHIQVNLVFISSLQHTHTMQFTCYTETEHYLCKDSTSWHHLNLIILLAINSNTPTCFGVHEWEATTEISMSSHYCIPIIVLALWMASDSVTRQQ